MQRIERTGQDALRNLAAGRPTTGRVATRPRPATAHDPPDPVAGVGCLLGQSLDEAGRPGWFARTGAGAAPGGKQRARRGQQFLVRPIAGPGVQVQSPAPGRTVAGHRQVGPIASRARWVRRQRRSHADADSKIAGAVVKLVGRIKGGVRQVQCHRRRGESPGMLESANPGRRRTRVGQLTGDQHGRCTLAAGQRGDRGRTAAGQRKRHSGAAPSECGEYGGRQHTKQLQRTCPGRNAVPTPSETVVDLRVHDRRRSATAQELGRRRMAQVTDAVKGLVRI